MSKKITKGELIKLLQEDKHPMDTEVMVYLDCINDDKGILGYVTGVNYDKRLRHLEINGEYEEDEY